MKDVPKRVLLGCKGCGTPYDPRKWPTVRRGDREYVNTYCKACANQNSGRYYEQEKPRLIALKKAKRKGDPTLIRLFSRKRESQAPPLVKRCPNCGKNKFVPDEFGYLASGEPQSWCKECRSDSGEKLVGRPLASPYAGLYLLETPTEPPPLPEAGWREYLTRTGERRWGWFVRLPDDHALQNFFYRFPRAVLTFAPDNPEIRLLKLMLLLLLPLCFGIVIDAITD